MVNLFDAIPIVVVHASPNIPASREHQHKSRQAGTMPSMMSDALGGHASKDICHRAALDPGSIVNTCCKPRTISYPMRTARQEVMAIEGGHYIPK